jgi:regulator of sirC expression with transglutaminase-like and TPR domain
VPIQGLSFEDEINRSPINVPRAALLFAREIAYPDLEVDQYLARLDQLGRWARRIVAADSTTTTKAKALSDFLFDRFGFRGNTAEYTDPRNSYLNEVLDRQLGIPISLSVIYVSLARQLGVPAEGIGLPGHFIVGIQEPQGDFYLDPFHGGRWLTVANLARLVAESTGYSGDFRQEWLEPASPVGILTRMLNNLKEIYLHQKAWSRALAVVERLGILQPELPDHLRDLGLIHHQQGAYRSAIHYYQEYLSRAPQAPDAELVKINLQTAAQQLAQLN